MSTIKKINGIFVPNTFVTGFTYNNANLLTISQNGKTDLNVYLNQFSGLTVNGSVSATTYYGDGSNLTGIVSSTDNYVTGGTYSNGTLTLDRQNGSVTITGFTTNGGSVTGAYLPLSGGTVYGNTIFQSGVTVNYIDFNTTATTTTQYGRINWDSGTGTLNIGVGNPSTGTLIDFQVGQEEVVRVFNGEATTLLEGEIVYVSGSQGNRPKVKRAIATGDGYSVTTLGMVSANITSGAEGYVTTFGIVSNLNTLGLTGGTAIWLSPTVSGGYTETKPQAPYHTVLIGYVVRVDNNVGSIFVNISNGWELDELHDVRINGRTEGDLLVFSSYSGSPVWVNSKVLKGNYTISGNTNNIGNFSATTFYGSGLGLNNIPIAGVTNLQNSLDLKTNLVDFVSHTGNTNNPHQTTFYNLVSTAHTHSISDVINLQTNLDLKTDLSLFNTHTGDTNNPHQTSLGNLFGGSAHTHTISEITGLQGALDLKTDLSLFNSHTANTNNPHQTSFYQLISTAHTHSISDVIDLQTSLNSKFSLSGGTVNGDVIVLGNVTILGSATTINTQTLSIADTVVTLNSNLTGGTPFPGHSGVEVLRGSGTTAALLWEEQRSQWEAGLHGSTKRIILQGDSLALLTSGHTHPISQINNLQSSLDDKLSKTSGGTVVGSTRFNGGLSAYTINSDLTVIPFSSVAVYDDETPSINSVGIAGLFDASTGLAASKYSLQLKDGTEGINKVLVSKTTDGKANWSSSLGVSSVSATTFYGDFAYVTNIVALNSFSSNTYSTSVANTQVTFSNNGTLSGTSKLTWVDPTLNINGNLKSNRISGTTLLITNQPTSGITSTQILMRNSTTGEVEITDSTSPAIYNYGMTYAITNFTYLT